MKVTIILLIACLSVAFALTEKEYQTAFTQWMHTQGKTYDSSEFQTRFAAFKTNVDFVNSWDAEAKGFEVELNLFADLTLAEFSKIYLGTKFDATKAQRNVEELILTTPAADSVDWRTKGYVTPIKDQGQCGSCWAFSAIGSIESGYAVDNNKDADTQGSEQQLVDCAQAEGNDGCNGGLMDNAFQYVIDNKGICTEQAYPYTATDGTCKKTCTKTLTIDGFKDVTANNATALMAAVSQRPVSIAVDASGSDWQFYSGGVLSDAACGSTLDHGVLNVGYSNDAAQPYWIVKNSWGTGWGNAGYIYIANTKKNDVGICGINMDPSFATGVKKISTRRHHKH